VNIPWDETAELAVLAGATTWTSSVGMMLQTVDVSDFYAPRHQRWFMAIKNLHDRGEGIHTSGIVNEMLRQGETDSGFMVSALVHSAERDLTGATRIVTEMSLRRRLLAEAGELQASALNMAADPADALDVARSSLASIDTPLSGREPDDDDFDDFLARTLDKPTPWVIRGLIRQGWRTVIVAQSGQGKTWLLRQFAVCAAYGIHPLRFTPIQPVRTMLIDLENPDDHLYRSLDVLVTQAKRSSGTKSDVTRLWRRPGGINLRKRADRAEVETLLTRRRPELLVLGPLYKSYRVKDRDAWDLVASEVQEVLDDWRVRFSLSILIEDHAPKGKDLVPFGSSLWLRWPEIGLGLDLQKDHSLEVQRWRGDRMPTDWPDSLERGSPWPWNGRWATGTLNGEMEF
jgi:replicative DNA helicase